MLGVLILTISIVATLVVCALVVSRRVFDLRTATYISLTFFALVLSLANYSAVEQQQYQLLAVRLVMVSATLAVFSYYLLTAQLAKSRVTVVRLWLIGLASIGVAILDTTDAVFSGIVPGTPPVPIAAAGIIVFFAHLSVVTILSVSILVTGMRRSRTASEKHQFRPLIIGLLPIAILAPITSFLLPEVYGLTSLVILTPLYAFIFVACVGYAIMRHGLFDVRQAVVRTFSYGLSLLTLAIIYFMLAFILSGTILHEQMNVSWQSDVVNVSLALLLAFLFQPVKNFFNKITNQLFYKDNYSVDEFINNLSSALTSTSELRLMLEKTAEIIAATLKSEQAFFFIHVADDHYLSAGTDHYARVSQKDVEAIELEGNHQEDMIVASQLPREDRTRRLMVSHRIEIALPLLKNSTYVGHLFLGEHKTSGYTRRDVRALLTVADELTIAIQNALSVEEVRKLNDTLQQRVNEATRELRASNAQLQRLDEVKDEFISMASHQLRTPLTSVKGYLSMVIEGDVGKINDNQKHLLTEAFLSSERMVRLIGDFLNVSRLQTGKFEVERHVTDLAEVVRQELEVLKPSALPRGIVFSYKHPHKFPLLNIDENKIRQVIMNFSDNAIYYSKDKSTIDIGLKVEGPDVVFTVKDTGIGVPESERSGLFNKFFRATNARKARPDGTGVGLFLAKKVIDAHRGHVIFETQEGKGSTFGFRLPLASTIIAASPKGENTPVGAVES